MLCFDLGVFTKTIAGTSLTSDTFSQSFDDMVDDYDGRISSYYTDWEIKPVFYATQLYQVGFKMQEIVPDDKGAINQLILQFGKAIGCNTLQMINRS